MLKFLKTKPNESINKLCHVSDGGAELANASVVHPRDPGSNLGKKQKKVYFFSVCVVFEFKYVGC